MIALSTPAARRRPSKNLLVRHTITIPSCSKPTPDDASRARLDLQTTQANAVREETHRYECG